MKRRAIPKTKRVAARRGNRLRRQSPRGLPLGLTLYFYPRTRRLTPAIRDPELARCVHRGLAAARARLARRGSGAIIRCVLFEVEHGEVFWLGDEN